MVVKLVLNKLSKTLHIERPARFGGDCYCGFPGNSFGFVVDTRVFMVLVIDGGSVWHRGRKVCPDCLKKFKLKFSLED